MVRRAGRMHPGIQRGSTAPHPAAGVTRLGAARSRSSAVVDDGQRVAQRARAPSSRVGARATAVDERSDGKSLFLQLMHATEDYFVYMDTNRRQLSILCTCPKCEVWSKHYQIGFLSLCRSDHTSPEDHNSRTILFKVNAWETET
jgi:hypothetical protein